MGTAGARRSSAKDRQPSSTHGDRCRFLAAGGALALGPVLAACGGDDKDTADSSAAEASKSGGPWSFEDDRGRTVKTDKKPQTIVAFVSTAAALYDYGIECKGVFGPSEPVNGKPNPQAGDMNVSKLTSLGTAWGQFNIEKYAALKPDLLVSNMFPAPELWYVPEESKDKVEALAPTAGISVARTSLLNPLRRTAELAESLGADLGAKKVTDAKARFEKAVETLRTAAQGNGGLKVMAVTGDKDNFYVAVPDSYCDLNYFKDLGVEFVEGKKVDEWGFWEFLSWENADKYHADLIMVDNRSTSMSVEQLNEKATWRQLPAVKADQITPWSMEERFSYAGWAPVLERLAAAVGKSKRLEA
ncbi:ABC transporter substrate-binding protein [Streptomyces spinoverrucosus]|uniref:ABC transporter substrate-binding protein n=1 Tax=Streptomyces spinoverrucosus TaxID=284043 RepID=A0A4Y3VR01_9ACTN|nr:ABC transporter substrate-binding protein [Streptomyces spinoverrucosus]GEC08628.1 ABC transporter substrate-binding protein [Streptomyces spinoverrucosus]GHB68722.1 ABC transporter substrate-binding protein [Streptomyces spinoverrucosus]